MIKWFEYTDQWSKVKRSARATINRDGEGTYPTASWKKQILLAEHSPIRKIHVSWQWAFLKSWVSVHFVRHNNGISHWVQTQRTDRTGINRDKLPQSSFVKHECDANAQALINISRKRLCLGQPAPETRKAWEEVKNEISRHDPILASCMVKECIYRGFCPEFKSCGYTNTPQFKCELSAYRNTLLKEDK